MCSQNEQLTVSQRRNSPRNRRKNSAANQLGSCLDPARKLPFGNEVKQSLPHQCNQPRCFAQPPHCVHTNARIKKSLSRKHECIQGSILTRELEIADSFGSLATRRDVFSCLSRRARGSVSRCASSLNVNPKSLSSSPAQIETSR